MKRFVSIVALTLVAGCSQANRGVLIMAHGGDAEWNEAIEQVVAPLLEKYPTEVAFGMADGSTMRTGVQRLEERGVREIAVVRMFISNESFLPETEYILGLRRERPAVGLASHSDPQQHGHEGASTTSITAITWRRRIRFKRMRRSSSGGRAWPSRRSWTTSWSSACRR